MTARQFTPEMIHEAIRVVDASPAVLWLGKGGAREILLAALEMEASR